MLNKDEMIHCVTQCSCWKASKSARWPNADHTCFCMLCPFKLGLGAIRQRKKKKMLESIHESIRNDSEKHRTKIGKLQGNNKTSIEQVRYTGYRDRPLEERQVRFQNGCREGHTEIAFAATGTNLQLVFGNASGNYPVDPNDCDFDKEHGKVHLRSHLIMNGVCVRWRGWIDLERLDGVGCLEYDEEHAAEEDALLRDQLERYNQRLRDFEEKQRTYRGGPASAAQPPHLNHHYHHDTHHATSHHHHHHGHHSRHVGGAGATGATATGIEPHLPHRQDPEMEVRLRAY